MRLTGNAKRINRKPVPRTTTTDPVIPNNTRGTIPQERKNPLPRKTIRWTNAMERRLRASETRWPPAIRSRAAISFWDIGTGYLHPNEVLGTTHTV